MRDCAQREGKREMYAGEEQGKQQHWEKGVSWVHAVDLAHGSMGLI